MKKYEFTGVTKPWIKGKTLYQIRAVKDFGEVHAGDVGGFIEKEDNLSHNGSAWVTRNAVAYGDCRIDGNSLITGNAMVSGESRVFGNATVGGQTHVCGNAWICGNARIKTNADYASSSGLGGASITAFMDGGEIMIVSSEYKGDIQGFLLYDGGAEIYELIELIKLHFGKR